MPKENITTLLGLLNALYTGYNSRKYQALVITYRPGEAKVRERFDDGRGHSGCFSVVTSTLDWDVFMGALKNGYVAGTLEPGYVSRTEFNITELGEQKLLELRKERGIDTRDTLFWVRAR